jgi:hypothetical protein
MSEIRHEPISGFGIIADVVIVAAHYQEWHLSILECGVSLTIISVS